MTAAAGHGVAGDRIGRRRLVYGLLAVSLVLNLFFVAGAAWSHFHRWQPASERFRQIANELDLTPQQRAAFDRYFQTLRSRSLQIRAEVQPVMTAAWATIARPDAKEDQIMALFDEAAEKRRAFQRDTTAATLKFLATLSPEQRSKFVTLVRERRALWLHR